MEKSVSEYSIENKIAYDDADGGEYLSLTRYYVDVRQGAVAIFDRSNKNYNEDDALLKYSKCKACIKHEEIPKYSKDNTVRNGKIIEYLSLCAKYNVLNSHSND